MKGSSILLFKYKEAIFSDAAGRSLSLKRCILLLTVGQMMTVSTLVLLFFYNVVFVSIADNIGYSGVDITLTSIPYQ